MKASQKEAECRWYEAAKSYEEEAVCKPQASSSNAARWEKAGSCYDRASRQTKNAEEFRRQRQLGVEAYEKAAQIYKKPLKNQGKNLECLANAELMRSWLATNATERRKILRRSCILGKTALKVYKRDGDELNYGKTCNTLALCMYDLQNMVPTLEGKRKVLKEGFGIAKDGVSVFSRHKRVSDFVFSLSLSSLLGTSLSEVSDGETGKSVGKTCLEYSKRAVLLSEEIDEPYSKAISRWAQITSIVFFEEEIEKKHSREYAEEMLQQSLKVGDNYLTGIAYYLIAGILYVTISEEPDIEKKIQNLEDIVKYSENAAKHLQLFNQNADIATAYYFNAESNSVIARISAITPSEKLNYLKKAIVAGEKGLEYAKISGSPSALEGSMHALSRAYYFSSIIESRKEKKTELLEEALRYRKEEIRSTRAAFASNSWYIGIGMVCEAQIEAELARLERDKENRIDSFKNAVVHMESGITECKKSLEVRPLSHNIENVARFEDEFGGMLEESYLSTKEQEALKKANDVYVDAAENFKKVEMPSRVAETCWKIARNLDLIGEYSHAAENFERGFVWYKAAAQKISQFGDFYLDYASYMKAWSEIEIARLEHGNEKYTDAMNHYEKASNLLKQSKLWNYLSSNFRAWSFLEQAEDLSRKDNCKESIIAFEKAVKFLRDSERVLRSELCRIDKTDEQNLVKRLIQASNIRIEYSNGRIMIEEAKILDRQGDYGASSQKYESAAETFKKILQIDPEQTGKEVKPLIFLCQAWQKMTLAEARSSPIMYDEAADLFMLANEHSTKESTSLLALGHNSFCKALEAGTEFEITRNTNMYEETVKHMNSAANYYLRAGFQSASDYAKATQRLFDAYVYMDSAKREKDPEKEAKHYLMAEKVLRVSAECFARSGRIEKSEQVQRLLWRVRDEKELALSLSEVFHASTITSSTSSFSTIEPNEEKAVGLERFEHADIQAKLIQHENETKVGENINIEIQIVNVGKEPVLMTKVESIIPTGFQLVAKPDYCSVEGTALAMRGTKLDPLKTNEITITLKSFLRGSFEIKPKIVCVDETGHQMTCSPEPATFNFLEAPLPGRLTTGYASLDNLLLGGIPENYTVILTCPSCDEREELIKRFLQAGLTNGQLTFYITGEPGNVTPLAGEFQSTLYLFICNPRADVIVQSLPNVSKLKGVENLTDIDIALTKAFRSLNPSATGLKRICIDVVSDVLLQHHAVTTRRWLSALLPTLKSKGFTVLAVVDPQMHPAEELQAVLGLFDGEITIHERETNKGMASFLRIKKMTGQKYLKDETRLTEE